jgi:signal transduction histidine kinase
MAEFTYDQAQLRLMNAIGQHTGLALMNLERLQLHVQTQRLAAMGQTVASLSHSVKNILQGLRGGADAVALALGRGDLALAREGWPILARNLDRIYALTMNMLTYSRPRQLDVELTRVDALVREVAELLRPQCEHKRVAILLDLDEAMPPIPLDQSAIHQALMNLLTNALEAMPGRRGTITVRTRYLLEAHEAEIQVADNGPGIAPERRASIFEAFTSTKGQRGTGLGLAVTKKIVTEHGGRIGVESTPGAGATFTISLPVRDDATAADTSLPRPMSRPEAEAMFWEDGGAGESTGESP